MTNVISIETKQAVKSDGEDKPKPATDVVREMIDHIAKDGVPYNRAVVVLLSDERAVGYRIACYNTPAFTALGMLEVAQQNITQSMMDCSDGK